MRAFCQPCQQSRRNKREQRQQGPQLLQQCLAPCPRQRSVHCSSSKQQDLYLILGVPYDADASDIKAAFRAKAKQLHPDVNQAADAEAAFRLLKRAHEVLSDGMLRAAHDSELREQLPEASAALRARDPRFARYNLWPSAGITHMRGLLLLLERTERRLWVYKLTRTVQSAAVALPVTWQQAAQLCCVGCVSMSADSLSWRNQRPVS
jgi:hypothetical protein